MHKYLLFCFFVLMLSAKVFSQDKVWFKDEFDDKLKSWSGNDIDGTTMTRKIEKGKFYFNHKDSLSNIYWSMINLYIHPDKPFSVETNFIQTESNGANGVGLILWGKSNKFYYFIINPSKKTYWVGTGQNSTWKTFNSYTRQDGWAESAAINDLNVSNKLKVHAYDGRIEFMVNDKVIFTSNSTPDFSDMLGCTWQGIVTCCKMRIEVENYNVFQDNPPINVAPNLPKLTKVNLGANVNSKYTEKSPYISPDGKTLYYVLQGDPENKGKDKTDEIFYSSAVTDSTWGPRQNMGNPLNNEWPNCVLTATPDNNTLYLMHTYKPDGSPKASGFSMTTKTESGWSVPQDLEVTNYYNNAPTNEFCFSGDRKVLLMAVRRNDTFGENDIYVSFMQDNGKFSEPKNLGNTVNTFAWESSPFLAPDGVSLYYSTAGYPGFGDADIFMTRRLDSTWSNWSTPLNMGPDINSGNWEAYYSVSASGKYAYVTSTQGGIEGSLDIYQVKLPEMLKPKPVVLIHGRVLNSVTNEPLESSINYNILASNKEIGIASSGIKDGAYKIVLPAGEVYSFLAKKDGFYSVSENLDVADVSKYKELERDLYLVPIEVGGKIRLNNLFFDFNKSNLRTESFPELSRLIKLLEEHKKMEIEIAGHTDNVGTDEINNKLSKDRATAVKNYLVTKGIAVERITSTGYGKTKPVAENTSETGRQKNRRVEFVILKK